MVRTAFRLRWLPRHVLMVALVAAVCMLGRWQWDVSESARGGLQNLLYAFQWWAMALIVIYGWWRLLRDDAYPRSEPGPPAVAAVAVSEPAATTDDWPNQLQPASHTAADDESDPELDDYNDYLAWLNARSQRAHH